MKKIQREKFSPKKVEKNVKSVSTSPPDATSASWPVRDAKAFSDEISKRMRNLSVFTRTSVTYSASKRGKLVKSVEWMLAYDKE